MRKISLALLVSALVLAGCKEEIEPAKGESFETIKEEIDLPYRTAFTGEPIAEEIKTRPVLATVNNALEARPQSGLASADIIYEMLAEGGITRLLALFQSDLPEEVGPIRSARSYFIDIAQGLDAFYIAHGYSPEAQEKLNSGVVDHLNGMQYDGIYFEREATRIAPHNSYISFENILAGAEKVNASMIYNKKVSYAFYEAQDNVKIGGKATEVSVQYGQDEVYNSAYTYNDVSETYSRFNNRQPTIDALTDEPLAIANILIFEMNHSLVDEKGRINIDLYSSGNAMLFQQGRMREIQWENRNGVLLAIEEDGQAVKLVPGQTWVHLVPDSPGIKAAVLYTE